jgi:hypothetical protein
MWHLLSLPADLPGRQAPPKANVAPWSRSPSTAQIDLEPDRALAIDRPTPAVGESIDEPETGRRIPRRVAILDWDSVACGPEAALVGANASAFTADWGRQETNPYPSPHEISSFVAEYEAGRGASFVGPERVVLDAALRYRLAYAARCQHSDGHLGVFGDLGPDAGYRGLLKTIAATGLRGFEPRLIIGILVGALAILTPPFPSLAVPNGPHRVGSEVVRWTDTERPETFTNDPADHRQVIAQAWYPADANAGAPVPYFEARDLPAMVGGYHRGSSADTATSTLTR